MLLLSLTKRICPLMSLAALVFGCGKKINDPESELGRVRQPQMPSGMMLLELNTDISTKKSYTLPYSAHFYFPRVLTLKSGDASGKRVRLTYNIDSYGSYEYHCFYQSNHSVSEMAFEKCVDDIGKTIVYPTDDLERLSFSQDKGKRIDMELISGPSGGLIIDALYTAEWFP